MTAAICRGLSRWEDAFVEREVGAVPAGARWKGWLAGLAWLWSVVVVDLDFIMSSFDRYSWKKYSIQHQSGKARPSAT